MTITLEEIKEQQMKLAEMIANFEKGTREPCYFEYQGIRIPLAEGERYVGTITSACGTKHHHTILLPGEIEGAHWYAASDWAAGLGGDLPDRIEQLLMFAFMKDQFKGAYYWSNTQPASDSYGTWCQHFDNGNQYGYYGRNTPLRARAVRRIEIE